MRNNIKKINGLLIIILFFCLVTEVKTGLAASSWEFVTKTKIKIPISGSINMKKNEFQDFNIFNNNEEITTDHKKYSVSWSSSDENILWIDKNNGKARADKYKKMKTDTGEVIITATIKNKQTSTIIKRKFTVYIGTETIVKKLAIEFTDGASSDETLEIGKKYKLKSITYDNNGNILTFAQTKLYRTYFGNGIKNGEFCVNEEGTYTIIVAAYKTKKEASTATSSENAVITGKLEVTVGSKSPQIIAVKQKTVDTIEITFNQAKFAKEIVEKRDLININYYSGNYQVKNNILGVVQKIGDEKTIIVTLLSQIIENVNYTFEYNGAEKLSVTFLGASQEPSYIVVVGGECAANQSVIMQVKAYNSMDVEVPIGANYSVSFSAPQTGDYLINGNTIYFFSTGKTASITAIMEGYNEYGKKFITLQGVGTYTSVDEAKVFKNAINGYAIAGSSYFSSPEDITYNLEQKSVCVGDVNLSLFVSYKYTDVFGNTSSKYIVNGADSDSNSGYIYESTNPACLFINSFNGSIIPIAPGVVDIKISRSQGQLVGVITVEVKEKRIIKSMTISTYDNRFSVTKSTNTNNSLKLDVSVYDQYGKEFDSSQIFYSYLIKHPVGEVFNSCFEVSRDGLDIILKEKSGLYSIPIGTTKAYNIEITAYSGSSYDTVKQTISLLVKAVDTNSAKTAQIVLNKSSVDMILSKNIIEDYNIEIQLKTTDDYGFVISDVPINYITSTNASINANTYSLLIMNGNNTSGIPFEIKGNTLILQPLKLEGNQLNKAAIGNYILFLYKGDGQKAQLIQSVPLAIMDTTPQIEVKQKLYDIASVSAENIYNALSFYRANKDISNYITIETFNAIPVSKTLHVYTIDVLIKANEINPKWSDDIFIKETITVGKTFNLLN